jgi:hypothetical protein
VSDPSTSEDLDNLKKTAEKMNQMLSTNPMRDGHTPLSSVPFKYGEESRLGEIGPEDSRIEAFMKDITSRPKGRYEGLPYKGPHLDIKENDPDSRKPQIQYTTHVKQFDLNKPEDLIAYNAVCQKIVIKEAKLSYEEKIYDNDIKSWHILMRWYDQFYTAPSGENYGH